MRTIECVFKLFCFKSSVKDYNFLTDGKNIFEVSMKSKEEIYEAITELRKKL